MQAIASHRAMACGKSGQDDKGTEAADYRLGVSLVVILVDFGCQFDERAHLSVRLVLQFADGAIDQRTFRRHQRHLHEAMIALQVVAKVDFDRGLFIARMCLDALALEQTEALAGGQFLEVDRFFLALVLESFLNQFHKSTFILRGRVARLAPRRTA